METQQITSKNLLISQRGLTYSSRKQYSMRDANSSTPKPKRGAVTTFSKPSQNRLKAAIRNLDLLPYVSEQSLAKKGRGFFITVTVPQGANPSQARWKAHKDRLLAVLLNHEDFTGCLWKAELQQNTGALHLHLLLFLARPHVRLAIRKWLVDTWCGIVRDQSPNFRRYSIDVQCLYGDDLSGLAKYLSKSPISGDQSWQWGRIWGIWGTLPSLPPIIIDLEDGAGEGWKRDLAIEVIQKHLTGNRKAAKLSSRWRGFTFDGLSEETITAIAKEIQHRINTVEHW